MHLLSSPKNAERLRASIQQMDAGQGKERDLIKP
jgi:antitoxin YefM